MIFPRQITNLTPLLWALLLSMALLCAQGVQLHLHSIDHDQRHSHITIEAAAEHSHLSGAHLSSDISHGEHHNGVISELDASPSGLLKKVSSNIVMQALPATALSLLYPGFYLQTFYRHRDEETTLPWRYLLSPPPRAPPL